MNIKIRSIMEANQSGVPVLYINKGNKWANEFTDEKILWDASPDALTLAEKSNLIVDGEPLIVVDTNKNLMGFYSIESKEGKHISLKKYYQPEFNDKLAPAPRRPAGPVNGHTLDKSAFDQYLDHLKIFIG